MEINDDANNEPIVISDDEQEMEVDDEPIEISDDEQEMEANEPVRIELLVNFITKLRQKCAPTDETETFHDSHDAVDIDNRLVTFENDKLKVQVKSLKQELEPELPNGPTTTTTTVEVQIHSVVLKVKHVFPNDEIKLQLMQPIKNYTPILISFRKWDLSQLPALTNGAKSEIWAVKTSASVERPRYVIVCSQKSKRDNAEADATHSDNTGKVSIRLALNGEYWPDERMQLDFAKQDYTLAYYNYTRFYSSYSHSAVVHSILDYEEFKQHALFVIDCSRQKETMKSWTVDIKLEIEADKGFPADTKAYCIIVHYCLLEYFPLTEVVRTLI
ncbi:unnamed protein product [Phaedon cochleariae]|uniref:Double jelly roll-like domain-containing protein n=1 Tax=Phaedon cochleariae TaxID=80249 RepID=A0A9N9S9J1_PHACE|nr:unnamed protein product [Phaedon cochleariae]